MSERQPKRRFVSSNNDLRKYLTNSSYALTREHLSLRDRNAPSHLVAFISVVANPSKFLSLLCTVHYDRFLQIRDSRAEIQNAKLVCRPTIEKSNERLSHLQFSLKTELRKWPDGWFFEGTSRKFFKDVGARSSEPRYLRQSKGVLALR